MVSCLFYTVVPETACSSGGEAEQSRTIPAGPAGDAGPGVPQDTVDVMP